MPELREVFEMTTKQMEPDLDAWRDQERRQRRSTRNKRLGALAVAAAIAIAAIVVVAVARPGTETTTPADGPAVAPADAAALDVAGGFVAAFGATDVLRAIPYLAEDADLSALDARTVDGLALELALLQANGYEQSNESCELVGSDASGTHVRCTFDFHAIRSDEIGRGPYSGSYFDLTVRDGQIVDVFLYWEIGEFSPQMWERFARWVSTKHPEEGAVMFNADYTNFQLTPESIQLWGQLTREYVEHRTGSG
jgi:hypothetical protein